MSNIIFDFDGTIASSLLVSVDIFNKWAKKRKPITPEELKDLRDLPMYRILEELRIPPWRVPSLLFLARREIAKRMDEIELIEGVDGVIKDLQGRGNSLFILSSNNKKTIRKFLRKKGLDIYFKKIYGGAGLMAKSKALQRLIRMNKLNVSETYYIGDETRDIHAAKKSGIHSVSVTWGFNGSEILRAQSPDILVDSPNDLLKVLT